MKIKYTALLVLALLTGSSLCAQLINGVDYSQRVAVSHTFDMTGVDEFGHRFASEHYSYKDKVTGVEVIALTTSRHKNSKMYQTHPQWTSDGKYIIFLSDRIKNREKTSKQYYAVSTENFEIVQITTGEAVHLFHLGWKDNKAFYFRDNVLFEFDLGRLLEDSKTQKVKPISQYEKHIFTLDPNLQPNGSGLDASQERMFISARKPDNTNAIYTIDFNKKTIITVLEVPFRIGHLQANPYKSGEIAYCWETGGDAPQRIWYLKIDQNQKVTNYPLYTEKPYDWVTHEVFMGPDRMLFHLMGHIDRLSKNQTGIVSIKTDNTDFKFHGQTDAGGYWHCSPTKDGKWLTGDTFDGRLYRINAENPKDVVLLTQGHRDSNSAFSKEPHLHQNVSPDGKWVLFNSSYLTENDIMLVPLFPKNLNHK